MTSNGIEYLRQRDIYDYDSIMTLWNDFPYHENVKKPVYEALKIHFGRN